MKKVFRVTTKSAVNEYFLHSVINKQQSFFQSESLELANEFYSKELAVVSSIYENAYLASTLGNYTISDEQLSGLIYVGLELVEIGEDGNVEVLEMISESDGYYDDNL